jgi:hypothetical protein
MEMISVARGVAGRIGQTQALREALDAVMKSPVFIRSS